MHPIFFAVGSFFIGTYGVLLAIALVAGITLAIWRARKVGLSGDHIMDIAFWGVIAGFVGGRITYILLDLVNGPRQFLVEPWSMIFAREGFVFLGGLLAAVAVCAHIVRRRKLNPWLVSDIVMTSLVLGHAIGRVGCFMAGCCYGKVADPKGLLGFLAVQFPAATRMGGVVYPGLAYEEHLKYGLITAAATRSLPVWPTQLFESAGNLAIFVVLMLLWRKRRFNGQILVAYVILYAVLRFCIEFLRGDVERGFLGPFSTSQWICLAGFVFALAILPYLRRTQNLDRQTVLERQQRTHVKKQHAKREP